MLGWSPADLGLFGTLPVLLLLSGFFSGAETALFGLSETQRMQVRRDTGLAGRAVESLLAHPRMLLITILISNMTVNVLYFVVSSILLMKAEVGAIGEILLVITSLMLIVLLGEVMPKLIANSRGAAFALLVAPPLIALHQVIGPLRIALDKLVVGPLSRLTEPAEAPPQLSRDELAALLDLSGRAGVIDTEEERILQDVLNLGRLKVRDVMTPRVRMIAVPATASRTDLLEIVTRHRFTKLPVYEKDLDTIVGLLYVLRYLGDQQGDDQSIRGRAEPIEFVPEMATLDQVLEHFRATKTQIAIVVDEFGGTAGIVAIEDIVEEIVGDISATEDEQRPQPQLIGLNQWRVAGDLSVHDWAAAFGQRLVSPRVATLGGLITAHLGRAPNPKDSVELGSVRLEVEHVEHARVVTAIVTLLDERESGDAAT